MAYSFNPFTGKLDQVGAGSSDAGSPPTILKAMNIVRLNNDHLYNGGYEDFLYDCSMDPVGYGENQFTLSNPGGGSTATTSGSAPSTPPAGSNSVIIPAGVSKVEFQITCHMEGPDDNSIIVPYKNGGGAIDAISVYLGNTFAVLDAVFIFDCVPGDEFQFQMRPSGSNFVVSTERSIVGNTADWSKMMIIRGY